MHAADMLARRDKDNVHPDSVAGVPDSGIAHAIGYANAFRHSFCPSFYQIHTDLAPLLHADDPEPEKPDREDETDSRCTT